MGSTVNDSTTPERTRAIAAAVPRDFAMVAPGFHSASGFELLQREARAFMESSMVPLAFQAYVLDKDTGEWKENKQAFSNCMIAVNMALRMRADPLMVMQNLYVVHGTPAWSAKFLIGLFNTCGRFSTIRYAFNENRTACFAWCRELATGDKLEGATVNIAMANAEGWSLRKGSKWKTMPEVMLMNRAAAFLIRTTAPELSLGLPMRDEAEDITDVEAREIVPPSALQAVREILRDTPSPVSDAEDPQGAAPPPAPSDSDSAPAPDPVPDAPSEGPPVDEPKTLPLKDGALTPQDAERRARTAKPAKPDNVPAFNVDVYARRIRAVADLDLLTLMREEIASMNPSLEREDLMSMVDARMREIVGPPHDDDEGM
jgi:hypothetical protein